MARSVGQCSGARRAVGCGGSIPEAARAAGQGARPSVGAGPSRLRPRPPARRTRRHPRRTAVLRGVPGVAERVAAAVRRGAGQLRIRADAAARREAAPGRRGDQHRPRCSICRWARTPMSPDAIASSRPVACTRSVARGTTSNLTPQEEAVSTLVAQGLSNREVAAELYVSPKTVQYHLTRIYAKLGVRSRSELAALRR